MNRQALIAALQWHIDVGADEALADRPVDATARPAPPASLPVAAPARPRQAEEAKPQEQQTLLGASEARQESAKLAMNAQSLDDLKNAIAAFDGIALKKTATNLVFSDGNPQAPIMIIGEAPGADEDRVGKPFVGVSGQLLDRILACIGLSRTADDPAQAVYIANILNWRPPGNRTPSPAEIEVSLPFIERHIALIQPKILIFSGGVSAQALLSSDSSISRLRGRFYDYTAKTKDMPAVPPVPARATYHPAYLLRTPAQKRAVWQDMLAVQQKRRELGLIEAKGSD